MSRLTPTHPSPRQSATLRRPPLLRLPRVCHIGTLNPADKREVSWEAHGLSVSLHPEEWEMIAKLGGAPWHLLERADGVFLDYWALGRRTRRQITAWGVENGLLTRRYVHELTQPSEDEATVSTSLHATRKEALSECELDAQPVSIRRVVAHSATEKLTHRIGRHLLGLDAFTEALVCFVEDEHPEIDGVWWEDEHGWLSAPHGCIIPARLERWSRRPLAREGADRLLLDS